MEVEISRSIEEVQADSLIVVIEKNNIENKLRKMLPKNLLTTTLEPVRLGDFTGSLESVTKVYTGDKRIPRLVLAGAGNNGNWESQVERARIAVAAAISSLRQNKRINSAALVLDPKLIKDGGSYVTEQSILAAYMANYVFHDKRKTEKPHQLRKLYVIYDEASNKIVEQASSIATGVYLARDIANAPPSSMNPEVLEKEAKRVAEENNLTIRILHKAELEALGMEGILAVGSGSRVEPRLIILEYHGGGKKVALVGKAVTFDAGGLDLKTAEAMYDMKFDKSGGAVVLGAIVAAARLKLGVTIIVLIPTVENLPSGSAYKPRDVLHMYNGITVEVGNTDAEGRLILADALAYAAEKYKPDCIIDFATLTGAVVIALGNHAAGLFSNSNELAEKVERAAWKAWEPVWRMPVWKPYYTQLESSIADTSNIGGRAAGAITAAAFLSKFVDERPWAHLDIAGVAYTQDKGPSKPYYPKGATGWGVRTVIEMLREL